MTPICEECCAAAPGARCPNCGIETGRPYNWPKAWGHGVRIDPFANRLSWPIVNDAHGRPISIAAHPGRVIG